MPDRSSVPASDDRVLGAAGALGAATLLSRVLGLVREQCFAILFGAGAATDAFYMAFRIPSLLRNLLAEGALGATLIPSLAQAEAEGGRDRAWRLAGQAFRLLFAITSLVALAGILLSPWLVDLYAHAFRSVPGKFELTVHLTRWIFPFFPCVVLSAALMGALNFAGRFFVPALSAASFNLVSVACGVVLVFWLRSNPQWGIEPIVGMAWGVLLGGAASVLLQLPSLKRAGYRFPRPRPQLAEYRDPRLRRLLITVLPGAFGLAAMQINMLVNSIFATTLSQGAVSWLNYAFRLIQFPIGLFGVTIASAALPELASQWVRGERRGFESTLQSSLNRVLAINLSAAAGLAFLAEPIVRLIFQYGHFGAEAAHATALVLMAYAVGLWAQAGTKLIVPIFYALSNTRIPLLSTLGSVVCTVCLDFLLIGRCGAWGLALGTSVAAILNLMFLLIAARKMIREGGGDLQLHEILRSFGKNSVIALSMGILCASGARGLELVLPEPASGLHGVALALERASKLSLLIGVGVAWVLLLSRIFGAREAPEVAGFFAEKLKKKLRLRNN